MKKKLTQQEKISQLQPQLALTSIDNKIIYEMKMKKINKAFEKFCREGDFEMIKYLLTSPDLEMNYNLHYTNVGFTQLCVGNHIDIIHYLLTSPELKIHSKISAGTNIAIDVACSYGHLDLVKFLLTSEELKEHANIYDYDSRAIINAYKKNHKAVINFLIDDYKIDFNHMSPKAKNEISTLIHEAELKKLKNTLSSELDIKQIDMRHKI